MTAIRRLLRSTRGATMVEYAILLALIATMCIGAVSKLGSSVNHGFHAVVCVGKSDGGFGCAPGAGRGGGHGKP